MADHEAGSQLKLYVHLESQPARAVAIFCRANNIEAQEIKVDLLGQESKKPEFKKINPMGLVPCINDDGFQLCERDTCSSGDLGRHCRKNGRGSPGDSSAAIAEVAAATDYPQMRHL